MTFLFPYGQGFACRNHIRVYKRIPGDPNRLLVCGTQAAVNPQCRTVSVSALVTLYALHVHLISVPTIEIGRWSDSDSTCKVTAAVILNLRAGANWAELMSTSLRNELCLWTIYHLSSTPISYTNIMSELSDNSN